MIALGGRAPKHSMTGPLPVIATRAATVRDAHMMGVGPAEFFADGRAPSVVAFHGFGGTAAELLPLLERFAGEGFAVDAALLPGHGTRVEDLQDRTFRDWLDSARERARAARRAHGRFVLLGFSLGSLVALELAGEHPEGLLGLVVLGNALTLTPPSSVPLGIADRLGWRVPDVYLLKTQAGDLVDTALMGTLRSYDRHPVRSALEVYRAGKQARSVVGRIETPTLILHGQRDRVCSWRNAPWLASHVGARDVTVRIFERSGHVLACDGERTAVADEVLAFVSRICAKSGQSGE